MPLEKQVVSLELAKKLKELGVKQESAYGWLYGNQGAELYSAERFVNSNEQWIHLVKKCNAYTVAELGEMLPKVIYEYENDEQKEYYLEYGYDETETKKTCKVAYSNCLLGETKILIFANTEANSRTKMLIYLIENNLITL
jgi:hypothetical protein